MVSELACERECSRGEDYRLIKLTIIDYNRNKERDVILEVRGHDAARLRSIDHAHGWEKDVVGMIKEKHGKNKITVSFDCETLKAEKAAEDHIKHFMPKLAGLDAVESDVASRLSVPKEWWDVIRPLFAEDCHEIELWAVDGMGMFWEFRCAVRQKGRYKKPVLQSDGWLKFVNYKGLEAGDMVILETVENQFRGTRFLLRALKYHADADGQYWFNV